MQAYESCINFLENFYFFAQLIFLIEENMFYISMVTCPTCLTNIFVENELSTEIDTQARRLSACIE